MMSRHANASAFIMSVIILGILSIAGYLYIESFENVSPVVHDDYQTIVEQSK